MVKIRAISVKKHERSNEISDFTLREKVIVTQGDIIERIEEDKDPKPTNIHQRRVDQ